MARTGGICEWLPYGKFGQFLEPVKEPFSFEKKTPREKENIMEKGFAKKQAGYAVG